MGFPDDFAWGVSTASYQIEGAAFEDGKGLSVWDVFCRKPGAIWSGHTGDVAIDHYHRYLEDIDLMKRFGIKNCRLSFSWPRILPEGTGRVNQMGLDFYDRLIDAMLASGIDPWVMLFHWDYPNELFRKGGWLNPDSPHWFVEYASLVIERYADRVKHWFTLEELPCFIGIALLDGRHAPGLRLPLGEVLQAGHNALLAHGLAVQAMRAGAPGTIKIGIVPAGDSFVPASTSPEDIQAVRDLTFGVYRSDSLRHHGWWLDAIYLGNYPQSGLDLYGRDAPVIGSGDMATIAQPLDFCAINHYRSDVVQVGPDGQPKILPNPPGYAQTTQDNWAISPDGIYWMTRLFHERYKLPILISENGHQNNDFVMLDGRVHDQERIDYTRRHLLKLRQAIQEGIPVIGYLHWTFIDNFEWAHGYKVRVGMVHADFSSQVRTPKDSAYWYRKVIATNGAHLDVDDYVPAVSNQE